MLNNELLIQINELIDKNCRKPRQKRLKVIDCNGINKVKVKPFICENRTQAAYLPFDEKLEDSFTKVLLDTIDKKGYKDSDIYNKAFVDRRLFSKIRSSDNKKVLKRTAIALCLALELNIDETEDLLRRAGYSLSKSNRSDLIIRVCIENGVYNIQEVDEYLIKYNQKPLIKY